MTFRIVVANEPRLCREALAGALKLQRPGYEITDVESNQLESALARTRPDLVIGTKLVPALRAQDRAPLLLYTPAGRLVVLGTARQIMQITAKADLTDVLSLVDAFARRLVGAIPPDEIRPGVSRPLGRAARQFDTSRTAGNWTCSRTAISCRLLDRFRRQRRSR